VADATRSVKDSEREVIDETERSSSSSRFVRLTMASLDVRTPSALLRAAIDA
jgi:hypothetical protein